jgi:hypothetical protein
MSIVAIRIKLDTKELERIAEGLNANMDTALGIVAVDLAKIAQANAPVDTGALRASIGEEHPGQNNWIVSDGVPYGVHVEFPGVTRNWAGHPFMVPAAIAAGARLNSGALWSALFE